MKRSRTAIIVLAVSVVALAASIVVINFSGPRQVDDVGSRDALTPATSSSVATESKAPASGSPSAQPRFESTRTDATKPLTRVQLPSPTRIVIPAINVDAPVDPVGVDDLGRVAVPTDVSRAGWYKWGPAPGNATGSAMITAHVDGVDQGAGAFFNLGELNVGDLVRVERADGSSLTYRVISRESFNKKAVPLEDVFARSGPPRLTLVTCGGPFDPQSLVYTDNIIVTAVPE